MHASAIYRRWPSRIELIEEATFPGLSPLSVQPTGDLRRDLRQFIRAYLAAFSAPAAAPGVPGNLLNRTGLPSSTADARAFSPARPSAIQTISITSRTGASPQAPGGLVSALERSAAASDRAGDTPEPVVIQHRFKLLLHLNYQGAQAVHHLLVRDRRFLFPYKDRPAPGFSLAQPWPDSNSLSNGCCCSAATTWRHCAGTAA